MTAPRLSFEGVAKRFGTLFALDASALAIEPGRFVALVGRSGSGKSTLLKTVNRLIEPDAGRVTIDGVDVADEPAPLLRRRIGYVFQNVGLFPHLTVAQNIAIGPRLSGGQADVDALLALVDLPAEMGARMPAMLSGGQQQRVGVARALAAGASLLLMDEPFGALDPVTRDALARATRNLHERLGLTTLMVTHDMAEALLIADRVLVMADGRIVADATPAALWAGEGGDEVRALMAVPKRQTDALEALAK